MVEPFNFQSLPALHFTRTITENKDGSTDIVRRMGGVIVGRYHYNAPPSAGQSRSPSTTEAI